MGRHTCYPARGPRPSVAANRKIQQALRGIAPAAFGIRRVLQPESNDAVTDATFTLHVREGGEAIPEKVELRDALSVTLLSQKVIGRQLSRGQIAGFHLGKARAMLEQSTACQARTDYVEAMLGDVSIHQGRIIYADVLSPELTGEVLAINGIMAELGLRGLARRGVPVPHVTLGETVNGHMLSHDEQETIITALQPAVPLIVGVQAWDTYPYDIFNSAAVA